MLTYLDHNSTTPLADEVLEGMLPFFQTKFGNPNGRYIQGRYAREAVEQARSQVAIACGARANQVIFTSGGTESNNWALRGLLQQGDKLLVSNIEHPSVLTTAKALTYQGIGLGGITCTAQGVVDLDTAEDLITSDVKLVSVMAVNNETGVIQPTEKLAQLSKKKGVLFHTDAVQALGKIPLHFTKWGVSAMSISAHKICGPQGIGAIVLDTFLDIEPILRGGGQENGLRSGTENLAGIVGFGIACQKITQDFQSVLALRVLLEQGLLELGAVIFAQDVERVANTVFFAFENIEGETLVIALDKLGYAVSSGSACSQIQSQTSHVLLAMGVHPDLARCSVRVSLDRNSRQDEIIGFLKALNVSLNNLRQGASIN